MDRIALEFYDWRLVATTVIALTGLVSFWSWVSRKTASQRGVHLPPGPRGLPVLGSLLSLGKSPHKSLLELSKTYGPVMSLRLGSVPAIVVSNGDMLKEVLQTNDHLFASRPRLLLPALLFYDNMDMAFTPYGPHWRQTRKICNFQLLTASRISHLSDLIEGEIMATIQSILQKSESGKAVDVSGILSGMAMNIMTQMMWRQRYRNINGSNQSDMEKFQKTFGTAMELSGSNNVVDFLPFFKSLTMKLTGLERKAKEAHKELDTFLEHILSEREQELAKKAKTITNEDDFVDVLLKLTEQSSGDSEQISRDAMKAILVDMLVGGSETTGATLDWALAELMREPNLMRKAQDELTRVVGSHRLVTQADIPNLKYLGAIVKETFRRRSPAPVPIPHFSQSHSKVGGYDVPANTMIFLNLFAVHHDPTVWDEPTEFNPDRFLNSDRDYKGRHFEYLPFSSGRRICPGLNLASLVMNLGLAQLLHTVNWSLPHGEKPESINMAETPGLAVPRASPLLLIGKPRVSLDIISSVSAIS